jgi:hypothetical protein
LAEHKLDLLQDPHRKILSSVRSGALSARKWTPSAKTIVQTTAFTSLWIVVAHYLVEKQRSVFLQIAGAFSTTPNMSE